MRKLKSSLKSLSMLSPFQVYSWLSKQRRIKKKKNKQKRIIQDYLESENQKKLQIGCGSNVLSSWLNTDLNDQLEDVAFLDAGEQFPIPSDSFDFIYSEHMFEHLHLTQQINLIKESFRVLKKGGILRIATPNLVFLINLYTRPTDKNNKAYMDWTVRNSPYLNDVKNNILNEELFYCYVINNFFKAWGHQLIHDVNSLKELGLQYGFANVEECEVGQSTHVELQNIEKHGTIIPSEFNKLETMVIEFTK
jgi:predicted SAM-dependent methyltransferase